MLGIFHHIREFLLSALKRYPPGRLLQYLLALCRAVFSRRKSKCSDRDSSHEFVPKTLTLAEGKESLSEGGIAMAPMAHGISGSTTPKQAEEGSAADANKSSSTKNDHPPELEVITSEPPLKKGLHYMWTKGPSLFNMVSLLDHPGLIQRSLAHTQIKKDGVYSTDAKKWGEFCKTYASDTIQVNLLATVLLAANMSFLGIPPINDNGLSYLPQRFSYLSLLAALASIVMGSAVRSPRLFVSNSQSHYW
ncbi:hypothetical protein SCLCIDRAFT_1225352 [Scleroderma citrinum Foug A]|uniref:Uncharacterized protein n=1 Tax=Scleroderma citrinum Foug A TaxID=1036808 RepID=A0A0C2ZBL4_9AGAM|nr:hypothetical protein SCLCIDRAFT_1225352 [Scleroderma citrinum Foug A]